MQISRPWLSSGAIHQELPVLWENTPGVRLPNAGKTIGAVVKQTNFPPGNFTFHAVAMGIYSKERAIYLSMSTIACNVNFLQMLPHTGTIQRLMAWCHFLCLLPRSVENVRSLTRRHNSSDQIVRVGFCNFDLFESALLGSSLVDIHDSVNIRRLTLKAAFQE